MRKSHLSLILLACAPLLLQACAPAVVVGGGTAAMAVHDRRTAGDFIEDQNIEFKAYNRISADKELSSRSHISVTSYNRVVLLTGQTPTPELRARAEELVRGIRNVRRVHNELTIAAPNSLGVRSTDTWITTKVKTALFRIDKLPDFDPTRVKVVTENGTVYLMGLLTPEEAEAVVDVVRQIKGVQRVVKIFEYIGEPRPAS